MMRKILLSIILLICALIFSGCVEKDTKEAKLWRKTAENNAVQYVQNKYEINAEIVDSSTIMDYSMFKKYNTSLSLITMKDENEKVFQVLIDGRNTNADSGRDNYQKNEIIEDYISIVRSMMSVKPESIEICYYNKGARITIDDYMLSCRYEGYSLSDKKDKTEALKSLFENEYVDILLRYAKDNVPADFHIGNEIDSFSGDLPVISSITGLVYNDKQDISQYPICTEISKINSARDELFFPYALLLDSAAHWPELSTKEIGIITDYYKFEAGHMDDFYYIIPNQSLDTYEIVKETMTDQEESHFKEKGYINPKNPGEKYRAKGYIRGNRLLIFKEEDRNLKMVSRFSSKDTSGNIYYRIEEPFKNLYKTIKNYDYYYDFDIDKSNYKFCFMLDEKVKD